DRVVYRLLDVLDLVSVDLLDLLSVDLFDQIVVGRTELEDASVLEIVLDLLPDLPGRSQCVVAHATQPSRSSGFGLERSSYGNFLIQTKRLSGAAFPQAIASSICRWCSSSEYPDITKTPAPRLARSSVSISRPIGLTTGSSTRPIGCLKPLQARLKVRNLKRLD